MFQGILKKRPYEPYEIIPRLTHAPLARWLAGNLNWSSKTRKCAFTHHRQAEKSLLSLWAEESVQIGSASADARTTNTRRDICAPQRCPRNIPFFTTECKHSYRVQERIQGKLKLDCQFRPEMKTFLPCRRSSPGLWGSHRIQDVHYGM